MSLLTRWTLVVGFLYAAFFEGLLANMPFSIRLLTIIYYARMIAYRSMTFQFVEGHTKVDMAAEAWQLDVKTDPTLLGSPLAGNVPDGSVGRQSRLHLVGNVSLFAAGISRQDAGRELSGNHNHIGITLFSLVLLCALCEPPASAGRRSRRDCNPFSPH